MFSRPVLALFLGAMLLYNLNFRPIPSGDTLPAAVMPLQLVLHGRATFDTLQPLLDQAYAGDAYFLYAKDGHYYSKYPVTQSLLLTPLYLPLLLAPGARQWPPATEILVDRILEKLMASAIASASVVFLFLLLRRVVPGERRALLLAAVYAFATNTWSTSSQALWQHGASQLTTVLSLLCLARFLEDRRRLGDAAGAGLFAALSVAMRPTDVLFFAASLAVVSWRVRRTWLLAWYAGFGALIGGALAIYNLRLFGNLRGGYTQPFDGSFWTGLAGLLASPSHGLLVYSPVLLFVLAGIYFGWRQDCPKVVLWPIALLFSISHLALYSFWGSWWGGDCYGPRMLADLLPCLILLLAPALGWIERHRLLQAAFAAILAFSVAVQLVGAFSFPQGFEKPEPLWDWTHSPIVRNARRGVSLAPYRVVLGFADDLLHGRKPDTAHTGMVIR